MHPRIANPVGGRRVGNHYTPRGQAGSCYDGPRIIPKNIGQVVDYIGAQIGDGMGVDPIVLEELGRVIESVGPRKAPISNEIFSDIYGGALGKLDNYLSGYLDMVLASVEEAKSEREREARMEKVCCLIGIIGKYFSRASTGITLPAGLAERVIAAVGNTAGR